MGQVFAAADLPPGVYATVPPKDTQAEPVVVNEAPKRLINLGVSYSMMDNVYQNKLDEDSRSTGVLGMNLSKTFILSEKFDTMSRVSFSFLKGKRDWIKNKQTINMTDGSTVSFEEQRESLNYVDFAFDQIFHYRVYENTSMFLAPYIGVGISGGAWNVSEDITTVRSNITSRYELESTQSYTSYKVLTGISLNWKKIHWWLEGQYRILNEGQIHTSRELKAGENRDFEFPYYGLHTLNNDAVLQVGFSINLR